jgi:TolA-binding protein
VETGLFPQVEQQSQQQPKQQQKEEKINLGRIADITHFQNANSFYKLKEYGKAIELFTEYLEIYTNGVHRKEAYKNIGAIYFAEFNYIRSIKAYQSLYEEYSNSEEGVEAYFMTGICNQKMGFFDKAKAIFKSLIEEHPDSNYAYQSRIKLDLIEILDNN